MAVKRNTTDIVSEMKQDSRVKRLKTTFASTPLFQIPVDSLTEEIDQYHKLRGVRRLNPQEPRFIEQLMAANAGDQSARSRLVEIIVECGRAQSKLEKVLDYLTQYLLITYTLELRNYRTKEERMYIIHAVLKPFRDYLNSVESLKASAQLVVGDVDKASWSMRMHVDILTLHSKREMVLGS